VIKARDLTPAREILSLDTFAQECHYCFGEDISFISSNTTKNTTDHNQREIPNQLERTEIPYEHRAGSTIPTHQCRWQPTLNQQVPGSSPGRRTIVTHCLKILITTHFRLIRLDGRLSFSLNTAREKPPNRCSQIPTVAADSKNRKGLRKNKSRTTVDLVVRRQLPLNRCHES